MPRPFQLAESDVEIARRWIASNRDAETPPGSEGLLTWIDENLDADERRRLQQAVRAARHRRRGATRSVDLSAEAHQALSQIAKRDGVTLSDAVTRLSAPAPAKPQDKGLSPDALRTLQLHASRYGVTISEAVMRLSRFYSYREEPAKKCASEKSHRESLEIDVDAISRKWVLSGDSRKTRQAAAEPRRAGTTLRAMVERFCDVMPGSMAEELKRAAFNLEHIGTAIEVASRYKARVEEAEEKVQEQCCTLAELGLAKITGVDRLRYVLSGAGSYGRRYICENLDEIDQAAKGGDTQAAVRGGNSLLRRINDEERQVISDLAGSIKWAMREQLPDEPKALAEKAGWLNSHLKDPKALQAIVDAKVGLILDVLAGKKVDAPQSGPMYQLGGCDADAITELANRVASQVAAHKLRQANRRDEQMLGA